MHRLDQLSSASGQHGEGAPCALLAIDAGLLGAPDTGKGKQRAQVHTLQREPYISGRIAASGFAEAAARLRRDNRTACIWAKWLHSIKIMESCFCWCRQRTRA